MFTKREDKCCNGGNQHKFKPRYTEVENAHFDRVKQLNNCRSEESFRSLMIKEVYVGDVCV